MSNAHILKIIITIVVSLLLANAYADTLYVNHAATGNNDGTSWLNAFTDVQSAISDAAYGDAIWVVQGTYLPTTTGNRNASFFLKNGIQLYGGFVGTETSFDQRDWQNNTTILSGDIGVTGDSTDNSYTVVLCNFADSTTVLDGFTISQGNANDTLSAPALFGTTKSGGGLYIRGTSQANDTRPFILNCTFTHNHVRGYGGGVYMQSSNMGASSPIFENCIFSYNTASAGGGGMYKRGGSKKHSTKITHSTFHKNNATNGGGIYFDNNFGNYTIVIHKCELTENECTLDAGGFYYSNTNFIQTEVCVSSTLFRMNSNMGGILGGEGGAIFYLDWTGFNKSNNYMHIMNCCFVKNSNVTGGAISLTFGNAVITRSAFISNDANSGGCMNLNSGELIISKSFFQENKAKEALGGGGFGGFLDGNGEIFLKNCLVMNSIASQKGGLLYITGSNTKATFMNCTISGYKAEEGSFADIDNTDTINIYNSIIIKKDSADKIPQIINTPSATNNINISHSLINTDSCSDIADFGITCSNNLYNLDPLFIDTAAGNYRLQPCSPARDAGSNAYLSPTDSLDLDSSMRIIGGVVDMGAYEVAEYTTHIDSIVHVTCHGGCDGGAVLSTEHGCVPYTVVYGTEDSIFQSSPIVLSGLKAGSYDVGVTDAGGRTTSFAIVIEEPPLLEVNTDHTSVSCTDAIYGTATAAVQGGSPDYTLAWSNGDSTLAVDSLKAGNYILTVTDLKGCTVLDSFTIEALGSDLDLFVSGSPITCHDAEDATIIATPFVGTAPFTWQWQGGQMTQILENVGAGSYAVTVSDALGCSDSLQITVDNPAPLLVALSAPAMVCFDSVNAVIVPAVSGGVPPYSFLWGNGGLDSLRMDVGAGDYQLILTDSNMCIDTQMVTIAENTTITLTDTIHHATGQTNADGAIVIQPLVGGIAPYSYMWNTGDTTLSLSNLLPGDYSLTVTDSLGCVQVFDYTVDFVIAVQELAGGDIAIKAYPNPVVAGGEIVLDIESRENATLQLQWVDVLGRVLMERKVNVPTGKAMHTIGVPEVAGVYWLVAGVGGEAQVKWEWVVVW